MRRISATDWTLDNVIYFLGGGDFQHFSPHICLPVARTHRASFCRLARGPGDDFSTALLPMRRPGAWSICLSCLSVPETPETSHTPRRDCRTLPEKVQAIPRDSRIPSDTPRGYKILPDTSRDYRSFSEIPRCSARNSQRLFERLTEAL